MALNPSNCSNLERLALKGLNLVFLCFKAVGFVTWRACSLTPPQSRKWPYASLPVCMLLLPLYFVANLIDWWYKYRWLCLVRVSERYLAYCYLTAISFILPAVVIVWYRFEACSRCGGCEHTERSWDDGEGLGEVLWGCRGTQAPTVERHQPWIQPHTSWRLRWPATSCMYQHHRPMIRMWRIPNLHPNPTESGTFPEIRNPSDT